MYYGIVLVRASLTHPAVASQPSNVTDQTY